MIEKLYATLRVLGRILAVLVLMRWIFGCYQLAFVFPNDVLPGLLAHPTLLVSMCLFLALIFVGAVFTTLNLIRSIRKQKPVRFYYEIELICIVLWIVIGTVAKTIEVSGFQEFFEGKISLSDLLRSHFSWGRLFAMMPWLTVLGAFYFLRYFSEAQLANRDGSLPEYQSKD